MRSNIDDDEKEAVYTLMALSFLIGAMIGGVISATLTIMFF